MMNPTGKPIRNDSGGAGYYGAPRSKMVGGKKVSYAHAGVDLQCDPGQRVLMPFTGRVVRVAKPYAGDYYSGLYLSGKKMDLKMFYIMPDMALVGKVVKEGEVIGYAQDISKKYEGVTPHVHLEIVKCDPEIFLREVKS